MTTKVTITCQENSHWNLRITAQDKTMLDPDVHPSNTTLEFWTNASYQSPIILEPGESTEKDHLYVHSTRRYIVEEVDRT